MHVKQQQEVAALIKHRVGRGYAVACGAEAATDSSKHQYVAMHAKQQQEVAALIKHHVGRGYAVACGVKKAASISMWRCM
jgi:glutamine amidotransferase-like uncharacterized protein